MSGSAAVPARPPEELVAQKASECARKVPGEFHVLAAALQERFGNSLQAVLLYGSCLHSFELEDSVADLYAVVDDYRSAYDSRFLCLLNRWLPPGVFYLERKHGERTLRCKYGVISMAHMEDGAGRWFHSYIWGRFSQPARLLYARDEGVVERIHRLLARATLTFLQAAIPALGSGVLDTETIWTRGLSLSYAAELRPERQSRARQLAHLNMGDFNRLTACAAPVLDDFEVLPHDSYRCSVSEGRRRQALRRWRMRVWQGRVFSFVRLARAAITFRDCIDYAAWKIERHTGIAIVVTPRLRRHPLLFGWKVLWKLVRRGVMH